LWTEMRTTLLNPKYIQAMTNGEASSAESFAETFRNTYGWNVMKPDAIDSAVWDKLYDVYVDDINNLNLQDFFERENPYALQEMSGVMLETARKGLWQASEQQLATLAKLHASLVNEFEAGCGTFTCGNPLLQAFIKSKLTDAAQQSNYQQALDAAQVSGDVSKGLVLTKEPLTDKTEQSNDKAAAKKPNKQSNAENNESAFNPLWLLLFSVIAGLVIIVLGRKNVQS